MESENAPPGMTGSLCTEQSVKFQNIGTENQPFTAPAMMPATNCLPATKNSNSNGAVVRMTPDITMV